MENNSEDTINQKSDAPVAEETVVSETNTGSAEETNVSETNTAAPEETVVSETTTAAPADDVQRNFESSKLPKLFKKSYSPRKFKRKILRHVYIPQDKKLLDSIFELGANPAKAKKMAVRKDRMFSRAELVKLKDISKDIKSHKMRVKLIPLAAVVGAITALVTVVCIFKNPLVKKGLKAACEGMFGAKTDIEYVNLRIFSTSLTIKGIAIGNKKEEFKNLFEAEKIEVDFNLVQALRGKFDAQNLEASGMKFNTDRTTSCFLPGHENPEEEENIFVKSLNKEKEIALEKIQYEITNVLGGTDVDSIVENIQSKLKTPDAAQNTIEKSTEMIDRWKEKPEEIKVQVTDLYSSYEQVAKIRVKEITDLEILRNDLDLIKNAIDSSKKMKEEVEQIVGEVKTDYDSVCVMAKDVSDSVKSDVQFAKDMLTSIGGLGESAVEIFKNGLNSLGYDIMGKFYPYAKRLFFYVLDKKENSISYAVGAVKAEVNPYLKKFKAVKEAMATKKPQSKKQRQKGTTYWYVQSCPSFLIERVYASGEGFEAELREVTNDQNVRNRATTFKGSLDIKDVHHQAGLVVDARRNSNEPLISVDYAGQGYKAELDGQQIATKRGVPSLTGVADITLNGSAGKNGFSFGGSIDLEPVSLSSDGFENEYVTKYYNVALGAVDELAFGYQLSYVKGDGLKLDLDGNFGQQFVQALTAAAMSIGMDAKNMAIAKLEEKLNSSNNEVLLKIKELAGIQGDIDIENLRLDEILKSLENKALEIERQIADQAKAKVNEKVDEVKTEAIKQIDAATEAATDAINDKVNKAKEQAEQSVQSTLENMFQGLGGGSKR